MEFKDIFSELLSAKEQFLMNDHFILKKTNESKFSAFEKDKNCPRISCNANVSIYDIDAKIEYQGKIFMNIDIDIKPIRASFNVLFNNELYPIIKLCGI